MRVLVISNMYPSKRYPHYGTFVEHTVALMRENGIKVDVVSIPKIETKLGKILAYFWLYTISFSRIILLNYNYIYVHYISHSSLPVLIASKFKKISIISNVHGNDIVPETHKDYKYLKLSKKILSISFKIVCPSEYFREILIKNYDINENKIYIYPSGGVDTKLFRKIDKIEALNKLKLSHDKKYIGYVSRLEKNKGYDIFLKACSCLHKYDSSLRFIVVGDGDESVKYEKLVDRYHLREYIIKFKLLSQDELVYIYNSLNVFVFPTYRKSESLGLVGLEAMACETVTVLPNSYGPTSYAKDEINSYVFKSGDSDNLVRAIKKALQSDNSDLCKKARAKAEEYDSHVSDEMLMKIFF